MSQAILKMANGNKVNWGSREYNYTDLENSVMDSLDNYLDSLNLTGKTRDEVRSYVNQYLQGFKNGSISRNVDGTYRVTDNSLVADNKENKRNIFGRVTGDKRRLALGFFDSAFKRMVPHVEKPEAPKVEEPKSEPSPFTYNLSKYLHKQAFKGGEATDAEKDMWYSLQDRWTPALKALNEYRESLVDDYDFSNTPFKDKGEYLAKLSDVETALNNKDSEALKKALYEAGEANLYNYFISSDDYARSKVPADQLATYDALIAIENASRDFDKEIADKKAKAQLSSVSDIGKWDTILGRKSEYDGIPSDNFNVRFQVGDLKHFFENPDSDTFKSTLELILSDPTNFKHNNFINNSITTRHGFPTIWKYDPINRTVTEILLEEADPKLYEAWKKSELEKRGTASKKEGGVLKAEKGLDLNATFFKEEEKPKEKYTSRATSIVTNNTSNSDKPNVDPKDYNLTATDWARLVGAGLDLISAISAYVPAYGTAVSAGTGVGSTLLNFGADLYDDNVGVGKAFANMGIGLAADAAGLIPSIGTASKLSKISKTLVKYSPYLIAAIEAYNNSGQYDKALSGIGKIISGKSLDKDELMGIADALQLITGFAHAHGGNRSQKRFQQRHMSDTTSISFKIKGADGKTYKVDQATKDAMSAAKQVGNGKDVEIFHNKFGVDPANNYDFGKARESYTTDISVKNDKGKPIVSSEDPTKVLKPRALREESIREWLANLGGGTVMPKKKKYKEDFNYVFRKEGGIIKAENGTLITNTTPKENYNRATNFLNSEAVLNYFRSINPQNYRQFNEYEDSYDTEYNKAYGDNALANWGTHNPAKIPNGVSTVTSMQSNWATRAGLNDVLGEWFTGVGNSGDRATTWKDGAFGNLTVQRTLGRGITPEMAKIYNEILNPQGLQYKLDPKIGAYRISPLVEQLPSQLTTSGVNPFNSQSQLNSELQAKAKDIIEKARSESVVDESGDSTDVTGQSYLNGKTLSFRPEMYSALRYGLSTIFNNNTKYNPQTVLTDAPVMYAKTSYNLPAENIYRTAANNYRELATGNMTSDAEKNFAIHLAAESKANDMELKGKLANLENYLKTSQAAQDIQNKNVVAAITNSNQNRARMVAIQNAKEAFERTKRLKQAQNTANFLTELQKRAELRQTQKLQIDEDQIKANAAVSWDLMSQRYKDQMDAAKAEFQAKYPDRKWEDSATYAALLDQRTRSLKDDAATFNQQIRNLRRQSLGFKSGGKVDESVKEYNKAAREYNKLLLENQKEFNKLLRFSIEEGNKTIRGLSKYAAELIKQSLKV